MTTDPSHRHRFPRAHQLQYYSWARSVNAAALACFQHSPQPGWYLARLLHCLPATPFGVTHCVTHTHSPIPHSHHQSASGQIAAAVRRMSDDWTCYLGACMTMGLWAEIERQKAGTLPHTCMTHNTGRSLFSAVQLGDN